MKPLTTRLKASTSRYSEGGHRENVNRLGSRQCPGGRQPSIGCVSWPHLQRGERHPKTSPAMAENLRCFHGQPSRSLTHLHAKPSGPSCRSNSGTRRPHGRHTWPGKQAAGGDKTHHHSNEAPPTRPRIPSSLMQSKPERDSRDVPTPAKDIRS
jgi:hypothetical protein